MHVLTEHNEFAAYALRQKRRAKKTKVESRAARFVGGVLADDVAAEFKRLVPNIEAGARHLRKFEEFFHWATCFGYCALPARRLVIAEYIVDLMLHFGSLPKARAALQAIELLHHAAGSAIDPITSRALLAWAKRYKPENIQ